MPQENITLPIILAIAGSVALLIGLFGGGVKAKEIEIPTLARGSRILSGLLGVILIGIAIQLSVPNVLGGVDSPTATALPSLEIETTPTQVLASAIPANTSTPTVIPTNTPSPSPTPLPITLEVYADQSWQASGVYIKNTDLIQVTFVTGQWQVRPDFPFTDPLGSRPGDDVITDPECHFPMLPSVAGDQALVAKIGENGEPFNPFKRIRTGEGQLFLRVNDCDKYLYDNSGSVTVRIQWIG